MTAGAFCLLSASRRNQNQQGLVEGRRAEPPETPWIWKSRRSFQALPRDHRRSDRVHRRPKRKGRTL